MTPQPQTKLNLLQSAALEYSAAGFATLPTDRKKRPTLETWKPFQTIQPTSAQIKHWFGGAIPDAIGVGIITGNISGNLEVLDVDSKHDLSGEMMKDFCSIIKEHLPKLFPRLVIAKTINGGYHIYVRVPGECLKRNKKLAKRPATADETKNGDKVKDLIETRGTGGFVIAAPTQGYEWIQGSFKAIPTITSEERDILWSIARSFDQMPVETTTEPQEAKQSASRPAGELSAFEDYNNRADIPALLERHGWRQTSRNGERIIFQRPGKTEHKFSANFHTGLKIFYVFTTSTEFESGRGFNPVQVYAQLEHNGDLSAASKKLYADGYGSRFTKTTDYTSQNQTGPAEPVEFRPEPKPLDLTLKPVLTIEDDFLPTVLVEWLRPASKVIGCPFDFLVLSAVIMIGSIIGSKIRVKPLRHSDWFAVPNLYGGCVGLPSTKKTPALDETRKPILELQTAARKLYANEKQDYEIEAGFYEKELTNRKKKATNLEDYKKQLQSLEKPTEPLLRRFEINDVTTPKLAEILSQNPNGLLQSRDELTGWMKAMEADYDPNARAFVLELWKGAIAYTQSRVGNGEIHIQSGTLSIIGGIQPSKLLRYIAEAYSYDNADGLPQRFLFAYPDANKRGGNPTAADYNELQRGFSKINEICRTLADFDFRGKTISANGDQFHVVKFDGNAQTVIDEWNADIEAEAESLQIEDEPFSSYLYKLPKSCFAIALIFHCLEHITAPTFPDEISEAATLKAIAYTEVLTSHARRVFALGENQIFALAQTLLGKIKKGDLHNFFTAREVARKQWSGLKTPDAIKDVIGLLIDYGYLREIPSTGEGRPTARYEYHPSLTPKQGDSENE